MLKIIAQNFTASVFRQEEGKEGLQPVLVKPGVPFDFTDVEVDDIIAAHGEDALRDPVNELARVQDETL